MARRVPPHERPCHAASSTAEPIDDELVERVNDVMIEASHRLEELGLSVIDVGHAFIGAGLDTLRASYCDDCHEHFVAELGTVEAEIARLKVGAGDWN